MNESLRCRRVIRRGDSGSFAEEVAQEKVNRKQQWNCGDGTVTGS